jgi:hypothetical protein
LEFNIDEISPLDNYKGRLANAITLTFFSNSQIDPALTTTLLNTETTERTGELFVEFIDYDASQKVKLHSRKKIGLTKELIKMLDDYKINYKVETI